LACVPDAGSGHRKKLEEAARLWARGELKNEERNAQQNAEAQAYLDEQMAALRIRPDGPVHIGDALLPFHLFPENREAWQLFMSVQTQWRVGMGGREGLDYPGVHCVIDSCRAWRKHRRRRFAEICAMERASLAEWAEQAKAQREG
jgi:hypothetical protein